MTCDVCGEDWEPAFFCKECSGVGELVQVRRPKAFWDYLGDDMEDAEEVVFRDVCGNCCVCHYGRRQTNLTGGTL